VTFFTVYVWGVLFVTLPVLWVVLLIVPRGRAAHRVVTFAARAVLRVCGCPLRVRGLAHLERSSPAVIVANHSSYLDALVLLAALPVSYRFVANHRAAAWPVIGLAIRRAGHLVVNRERLADRHACARAMLQTLRDGISVVVFPQGTIDHGDLLPFRSGAFRIAMEVGRPVVPIALSGTRHVLPGGPGLFRRGPLHVSIREPIAAAESGRRAIARARDDAQRAISIGIAEACAR
jgi:1-acyl-sn-glycerol-3-phosphate acyltransferase